MKNRVFLEIHWKEGVGENFQRQGTEGQYAKLIKHSQGREWALLAPPCWSAFLSLLLLNARVQPSGSSQQTHLSSTLWYLPSSSVLGLVTD